MPTSKAQIAAALVKAEVLRHGVFTLKSGARSPIYVDLRVLPSDPDAMDIVTDGLAEACIRLGVDVVAGAETAGIPLAAVVGHKLKMPMIYVRKEPKGYGTGSQIEGVTHPGQRVALLDDLITQGTSKFTFLEGLARAEIDVACILVVLDRQQGGTEAVAARGSELHSLITFDEMLTEYLGLGALTQGEHDDIRKYLADPEGWERALDA
jgi:orotate phosphoribosyltransferase